MAAGRHTHPASELSCKLANERPNRSGTELFYSIDSAYSYPFLRRVVCRLSHSFIVLKPLDGFRCNHPNTLRVSNNTLLHGVPECPKDVGRFGGLKTFVSTSQVLQVVSVKYPSTKGLNKRRVGLCCDGLLRCSRRHLHGTLLRRWRIVAEVMRSV